MYENSNPHSLLTAFRLLLLTLYCFCSPIQSRNIRFFFLSFSIFRLFVVFPWKVKWANTKRTKVHLWERLYTFFFFFYMLGVFQEWLWKEFRSFSIIWLQQVGHCMNEIAIIEFESFRIRRHRTKLPSLTQDRFEGKSNVCNWKERHFHCWSTESTTAYLNRNE